MTTLRTSDLVSIFINCDSLVLRLNEIGLIIVIPVLGLFDRRIGLMVPKDGKGQIVARFHDIEWGFGYVEGNAWHHRCVYVCVCACQSNFFLPILSLPLLYLFLIFIILIFVSTSFPPYALENLADLHGGSVRLLAKLHNLLDRPSDFMPGAVAALFEERGREGKRGRFLTNGSPQNFLFIVDRLMQSTGLDEFMLVQPLFG